MYLAVARSARSCEPAKGRGGARTSRTKSRRERAERTSVSNKSRSMRPVDHRNRFNWISRPYTRCDGGTRTDQISSRKRTGDRNGAGGSNWSFGHRGERVSVSPCSTESVLQQSGGNVPCQSVASSAGSARKQSASAPGSIASSSAGSSPLGLAWSIPASERSGVLDGPVVSKIGRGRSIESAPEQLETEHKLPPDRRG
jgi:hypothetical protein